MVTGSTVRRRRGATDNASSTTTTTTQVPSATTTNPSTQLPPPTKTVPEVLDDESKSLRTFLTLTAVVLSFFLFMIVNTTLPPPGRVFAVIIDAGSTGTRAQVFTFRKDPDTRRMVLDDTKMFREKTSIAALATGASEATPFFKPLLEKVKKAVPGVRRRKRTPIALRATGGLRLLGEEAAERALELSRKSLNASEFLFEPEWASVLEEQEEATHAWTTVNYLTGGFDQDADTKLFGALELGGASLQVVYHKDDSFVEEEGQEERDGEDGNYEEPENTAAEMDTKVKILGTEYVLHTTSYLGLGLKDFTKKLYMLFDREGVLEEGNPCFRKGKVFNNKKLLFGVPGSEEKRVVTMTGDGDFERCVASAEIVIGTFTDLFSKKKKLPKGQEFFAFAYFYDKTVKLGLSKSPSKLELDEMGRNLCETPADEFEGKDIDEACTEFSYIYALLKLFSGNFSEEEGARIRIEQFIDGHMLGWALGAALETVQPVMHKQLSLDHESLISV